jgi:hypothetical protein
LTGWNFNIVNDCTGRVLGTIDHVSNPFLHDIVINDLFGNAMLEPHSQVPSGATVDMGMTTRDKQRVTGNNSRGGMPSEYQQY